ncbi:MAG: hypothetical protein R3C59_26970 [Planctomycetaceae bacterium]
MITHGWKTAARWVGALGMLTLLSGCQTVQFGTPHPFSTLFRDHGKAIAASPDEDNIRSISLTQQMPPWFEPQSSPTVTALQDDSSPDSSDECIEL